ncbi:hypothetical protein K7J14_00125 [Treponema zuelzerae]|uniref:Uncharacterized protein n=1 Tax=Teretinema zuelzerae TaxID=156 RepID=A0AAE3EF75_9SPIR|nr:hypothetical protein [Teretinema zuelzerae]MCD1653116.1 hypothetical protein [Teretinema zuelzerae]
MRAIGKGRSQSLKGRAVPPPPFLYSGPATLIPGYERRMDYDFLDWARFWAFAFLYARAAVEDARTMRMHTRPLEAAAVLFSAEGFAHSAGCAGAGLWFLAARTMADAAAGGRKTAGNGDLAACMLLGAWGGFEFAAKAITAGTVLCTGALVDAEFRKGKRRMPFVPALAAGALWTIASGLASGFLSG